MKRRSACFSSQRLHYSLYVARIHRPRYHANPKRGSAPQRLERNSSSTAYYNSPMPFSIFFHRRLRDPRQLRDRSTSGTRIAWMRTGTPPSCRNTRPGATGGSRQNGSKITVKDPADHRSSVRSLRVTNPPCRGKCVIRSPVACPSSPTCTAQYVDCREESSLPPARATSRSSYTHDVRPPADAPRAPSGAGEAIQQTALHGDRTDVSDSFQTEGR